MKHLLRTLAKRTKELYVTHLHPYIMHIPSFTKKQYITIGICTVVLFGSFTLGALAFLDNDAWIKAEITASQQRIAQRSEEWADIQPKARRERERCEYARALESRLTELNVANNQDRKHIQFLQSLLDPT